MLYKVYWRVDNYITCLLNSIIITNRKKKNEKEKSTKKNRYLDRICGSSTIDTKVNTMSTLKKKIYRLIVVVVIFIIIYAVKFSLHRILNNELIPYKHRYRIEINS